MLAICPALDSARTRRQEHATRTAGLFKEVLQLVPFHTRRKVSHEDLGNHMLQMALGILHAHHISQFNKTATPPVQAANKANRAPCLVLTHEAP